jgi:hypothetical protein
MPIGISGDSSYPTLSGVPVDEYSLVELRVISNLLQLQQGNFSLDELRILRNDQAFELGIPTPVPGN